VLQVLQHLPHLKSLVLTRNFPGGDRLPIHSIQGFGSLKVLVVANCELSVIIPSWLQGLQSLDVLDFSYNKLGEKIPPWMGNLNNLFHINLNTICSVGSFLRVMAQVSRLLQWMTFHCSRRAQLVAFAVQPSQRLSTVTDPQLQPVGWASLAKLWPSCEASCAGFEQELLVRTNSS
jgi:hypothetical protein